MQGLPLGFQTWAIAIYLMTTGIKGVSSLKLHRDLGITQKSAWFLAHRIRETFKDHADLFIGPVEVDETETYLGGKEKNKHANKKLHLGRGGVGKAVVVGAKDRSTNKISAKKVEDTTQKTLHKFVCESVEDGSTVYTDDHRAYQGLPRKHEASNIVLANV